MNKTFYILLFVIFGVAVRLSAQVNLVPNPSFEVYDTCPDVPTVIYFDGWLQDWFTPNQGISPDYYNSCFLQLNGAGVPSNFLGYQEARTGIGYAGFASYFGNSSNYHEFVQVKLIQPLVTGKIYTVGFYLSLADTSDYAVDRTGAYLSASPTTTNLLSFNPQIDNISGQFLVSKTEWMLIQGDFIAQGGEEYLTIGNFRDDFTTNIFLVSQNGNSLSYYFIDDVFVFENQVNFSSPNVFTPNADGINDNFTIKTSGVKNYSCSIYDRWGAKIKDLNKDTDYWDGTNENVPCNDGVYYYVANVIGIDDKEYEFKGFVQLLR